MRRQPIIFAAWGRAGAKNFFLARPAGTRVMAKRAHARVAVRLPFEHQYWRGL